MAELKVKYIPIGDVKPYGKNPRKNAGAVKYVANSLREFGWRQPIVIDSGGVIVAGHTRLLAAQSLGMETVPVVVADDLTPEQIRAYRLADNKTAEFAEWDADLLDMELDDLDDIDMSLFGFELDEPEETEQAGSDAAKMKDKYLVPPFSVIYGNKPDWLARKRAWVNKGLRSELGRGGGLAYNTRSNPQANFLHNRGGRAEQSLQEQQPIKQLHDRTQALSTNTIAYMNQGKRKTKGKQYAKAYADGLIEKREQIRKGKRHGAIV